MVERGGVCPSLQESPFFPNGSDGVNHHQLVREIQCLRVLSDYYLFLYKLLFFRFFLQEKGSKIIRNDEWEVMIVVVVDEIVMVGWNPVR